MEKKYRRIIDFSNFELLESNSSIEKSIQANRKMKKAIVWCIAKKGFFSEMISALNIYGSSKVETMQTNGINIVYGIDFVLNQTEKAVRMVLLHEVLHCFGQHMTRRGGRDPYLWNVAADYAINPILAPDCEKEGDLEWPQENGEPIGLYEERFAGMNAEDIYEIVIKEKGDYGKNFGEVTDADVTPPPPDSEEDIVRRVFKEIEIKPKEQPKPGGTGGTPPPPPPPKPEEPARQAMPGEIIVVQEGPNKGKIFQVLDVNTAAGNAMELRELTAKQATAKLMSKSGGGGLM
jgi:hypothetical protein